MSKRRFAPMGLILSVVLASLMGTKTEAIMVKHMEDWDIVVAADATACERYAAEEFQRFSKVLGTIWVHH